MKRCPDCDAEYDDHVEYCFVDGADLVVVETPVIGAPGSSATPVSEERGAGGRGLLGLGVFFLIGGGVLLVLLGLGVTAMYMGGSTDETDGTTTAANQEPKPVPIPPPEPEPEPEPQILQLGFTSSPEGASVWEGDTQLCDTPCVVEHPEHAPVPRTFVLKATQYRDTEHVVEDPRLPQHVELTPVRARPRPRPRPRPDPTPEAVATKPDPKPAPNTAPTPKPAPAGTEASETDLGVKTNDLVDPWQQQ